MLLLLVGTLASASSFGLLLSPWSAILKFQRENTTGDYSIVPYLSMMANVVLWGILGIFKLDPALLIVNSIGVILSVTYVISFVQYCPRQARAGVFLSIFSVVVLIFLFIVFLAANPEHQVDAAGLVASGASIVLSGSPLVKAITVVRTKNAESLPLPQCAMTFVSNACWIFYGSLLSNWFIVFPGVIGTMLGALQLLLIGLYYKPKGKLSPQFLAG